MKLIFTVSSADTIGISFVERSSYNDAGKNETSVFCKQYDSPPNNRKRSYCSTPSREKITPR